MALVSQTAPVLVISRADDPHVPPVAAQLARRGIAVRRFDPGESPLDWFVALDARDRAPYWTVSGKAPLEGRIEPVRAAWLRRPTFPSGLQDDRLAPQDRRFVVNNRRSMIEALWASLDCRWLPCTPSQDEIAGLKPLQLQRAIALGLRVPRTRVGSSPNALLEMYEQCPQGVVVKTLLPQFLGGGRVTPTFTRVVHRRELRRFRSLRQTPVLIQELLPKACDVRVTVVGERVFATAIDSQEHASTQQDFRTRIGQLRHRQLDLPKDLERRCVDLLGAFGLRFAAMDFVLTPDGEFVFLELNPNGQWMWIEERTGVPIAEAIADELAG